MLGDSFEESILTKKKRIHELVNNAEEESKLSDITELVTPILLKLNIILERQDSERNVSKLIYKFINIINNQQYYRADIILNQIRTKLLQEELEGAKLFSLEAKYYLNILEGGDITEYLNDLAKEYRKLSYYSVAEFLYEVMLDNDQSSSNWVYNGLGQLYWQQGKDLIKNVTNNKKMTDKVQEEAKGYLEAAIRFYEEAIEVSDSEVVLSDLAKGESYVGMAKCHFALKEVELAMENCEKAIALDEDNYYAYITLGKIYNRLAKQDKTKAKQREKILEIAERKVKRMANNLWVNSVVAETQNKLKEAKIYWQYLIEINADYSEISKNKLNQYY
ncbi:tetratricopeptide repeat protein [Selenihalanaerobacter shriftii]|uniref:Uncharacterized protein n=1 Tax=Selenihalanaerobacter shriftii TaxID=142842 RepID=A0A1T4Q0I3_9FIRM|nr:hypothetical protein [Selenihalanaerobacter shriftii]SJZ97254.1 hypothetical protein SAMN02745118_02381 [Selenihalanaerobacter shriftii]